MAKLLWSLKDDETLTAKGDDTMVEFSLKPINDGEDDAHFVMTIVGHGVMSSPSLLGLMLSAQHIEDNTSAPDVTEGAGYVENH